MTEEQQKHLDYIIEQATKMITEKYTRGVIEHGKSGNTLKNMPYSMLQKELTDEAVDLLVYRIEDNRRYLEEHR